MKGLVERKRLRYWEDVTKYFVIVMTAVFPLLVGVKKYSKITEFKFHAFVFLTCVYLAVCFLILCYAILAKRKHIFSIRKEEFRCRLNLPQILMIAFMVWTFISALRANYLFVNNHPNGQVGFSFSKMWLGFGRHEGVLSVLLYGAIFFFLSYWAEYSVNYIRLISVSILIFCFIAYLQFFVDGVIYPRGYKFWGPRFISTMGNVDMVGGYVAIVLPLMFCSYVFSDNKLWKKIYFIAFCLMTYVFLIADVDSGKVGILAGFIFSFCFIFDTDEHIISSLKLLSAFVAVCFLKIFLGLNAEGFKITFNSKALFLLIISLIGFGIVYLLQKKNFKLNIPQEKMRKYSLFVLISVIVASAIFIFLYKGNNVLLKDMSEAMHFRLSDKAGSGRGYIWKTSISKLACTRPIFGFGPGTFGVVYRPFEILKTYTDFAHNDFIQIAVCQGFVGVAIYVAFCVSLLLRALKKGTKCSVMVILGASCASYLVHSFFSFSIAIISPIFWVIAGLLDKSVRQAENI